jgi:hypothetical protein
LLGLKDSPGRRDNSEFGLRNTSDPTMPKRNMKEFTSLMSRLPDGERTPVRRVDTSGAAHESKSKRDEPLFLDDGRVIQTGSVLNFLDDLECPPRSDDVTAREVEKRLALSKMERLGGKKDR